MVHPGPDFSVADVFNGWKRAFEALGHEVAVYNTNDRLSFYSQVQIKDFKSDAKPCPQCGEGPLRKAMDGEDAVIASMQSLTHDLYSVWPHMVFMVSAFFTPAWILDLIRARRHQLVILHTESPYQDDEQLMRAQYANLNLLNDPTNLEEYSCLAPTMYMPHAYDPEIHYPGAVNEKEIDFTFIGTMFESRREFFEGLFDRLKADGHLDSGRFNFALGGSGWDGPHLDNSILLDYLSHPRDESVDNRTTAAAYRASKVGINFYRRESEDIHKGEGVAMGPREVEMAACGIPFIRDSRPESDEVFPFLPTFTDVDSAYTLLMNYLVRDDWRNAKGEMAREAVKDRTFGNHAEWLLDEMRKARMLP